MEKQITAPVIPEGSEGAVQPESPHSGGGQSLPQPPALAGPAQPRPQGLRWWELTDVSLSLPPPPQLSGGCELTVVIHDFTACNSTELTIRRGQTVEVLERPHDKPDWCLVRTTDRSPAAEGLVPCGSLCIAHSRSSMEMEGIFNHKGRDREARLARAQLLPLLLCSLVRGMVSPHHSCFPPLSLCLWAFLIHQELEWT